MIEWFQQLMSNFGQALQSVLPLSPFTGFIQDLELSDGLAWLNWFIPVGQMVEIFGLWLVAYGVYLLYRIVLRWIKAVA